MELRHLRYFICVAEEMHFGRAAVRLGISQPPLSQQIRLLEDDMGVRLFDRTSRRVQLTEAGRLFLPQARQTIEQARHAVEIAQRAQRGEVGTLALGFTTSAPFVPVIASELHRFQHAFPEIHLELVERDRETQLVYLAERKLDIGIVRGFHPPPVGDQLRATLLLEEPMMAAVRSDHRLVALGRPLTIQDLSGEPFVVYEPSWGAGFNEHLVMLCRNAGFEMRVVNEATGLATLIGLVAAGFGVTVIATSLSALHPENISFLPIVQPDAISRLWLVHHIDMSAACRLFVGAVAPSA
ncbi:MAG TPA: LysR substrate-binding domain-containing protein [Sphingobium sp.]